MRFAHSAGPGLRSCKILYCASHFLTKNAKQQDGMLTCFATVPPIFSQKIFKCFDVAFPQNKETIGYLKNLGVKKIKFLGNLKFSGNEYQSKNIIKSKIKKFLKNKNYWCAASTHYNEEIICANTHLKLKRKIKNLVTFIIPRHVQRTDEIINSLKNLS